MIARKHSSKESKSLVEFVLPYLVFRFPSKNPRYFAVENSVERFFGKSDLESKEEGRVESPFFKSSVSVKESEWKNRSMEFPSRIYLYTWPPSSSLRTAEKRRLRGRETGHMSRARKKRVRTVSSRFYFGSCPFLLRISGTGEWREHEFHRFLTYSALLQPSCGRDTRWKTI